MKVKLSVSNTIQDADFFHWAEIKSLLDCFKRAGEDIRFVGGAVRDALIGRPVVDVDFCTPLMPDAVMELLRDGGIKNLPTGIDHGTITAFIGKKHFEITTLRRDIACDGRHAKVAFATDYAEDASRRDFTINALSADIAGRIYDYHDGMADLQNKTLRFIGNAATRIEEDALRMLRLFRFQSQLQFEVDATAAEACKALSERLQVVSRERKQQEVVKLLSSKNPQAGLLGMQQASLWYALFHGVLHADVSLLCRAEDALGQPADPLVRMAYLADGNEVTPLNAVAARLQDVLALSNQQTKTLALLISERSTLEPNTSLAERRKLQRRMGTDLYQKAVLLSAAKHDNFQIYNGFIKDATLWQPPEFPVKGADLIALGLTPGKTLGQTLANLEFGWEDANYVPTKEELLKTLSNI